MATKKLLIITDDYGAHDIIEPKPSEDAREPITVPPKPSEHTRSPITAIPKPSEHVREPITAVPKPSEHARKPSEHHSCFRPKQLYQNQCTAHQNLPSVYKIRQWTDRLFRARMLRSIKSTFYCFFTTF
jgi:hypothetical protein